MEHTFQFTEGFYPNFSCDFNMPAMLYDKLKDVVTEYFKENQQ